MLLPEVRSESSGARGRRRIGPRRWTMLGPAFVAAIAYVDPGNVAANLSAGAGYGYSLVWILVLATACAGVVQFLSAKLGVVTGRSLPELLGSRLRTPGRLAFWAQAEAVAIATDLAEVVGGAVALYLLFDVPLLMGGIICGVVSLALLLIQDRRGQRPFERVVMGLLAIIAIGFVAGLFVAPPDPAGVMSGLVPGFADTGALLLATAMLGATVMPHVVYLHSALSRDRFGTTEDPQQKRNLLKGTRTDVIGAMLVAGAVNISMLLLAASALRGQEGVDTLEGAHAAVSSSLGPMIGVLFGIGLLVSGLASTSVGCYAGSVIMAGLLRKRISLFLRRAVTLLPALVLLATGAEPTMVLVLSQVVLSFGLPLVIFPLIKLTSDPTVMGEHANPVWVRRVGWAIGGAVSALNIALIVGVVTGS